MQHAPLSSGCTYCAPPPLPQIGQLAVQALSSMLSAFSPTDPSGDPLFPLPAAYRQLAERTTLAKVASALLCHGCAHCIASYSRRSGLAQRLILYSLTRLHAAAARRFAYTPLLHADSLTRRCCTPLLHAACRCCCDETTRCAALLLRSPTLVTCVADLLTQLLRHSPLALPRFYTTGAFIFLLSFPGAGAPLLPPTMPYTCLRSRLCFV